MTFLINLFHCSVTFKVKIFSHAQVELPVFQFVPLVLLLGTAEKSLVPYTWLLAIKYL